MRCRLQSLRFWLPDLDPRYPETCGTGPESVCQYSCSESAFQVRLRAKLTAIGHACQLGCSGPQFAGSPVFQFERHAHIPVEHNARRRGCYALQRTERVLCCQQSDVRLPPNTLVPPNQSRRRLQTAQGPLTLNATSGIVVLRSPQAPPAAMPAAPPALPSKAQCSFIAKAARAATTGAGAIIIVNQVTTARIAMTSGNTEVGIQCAPATLPPQAGPLHWPRSRSCDASLSAQST